MEKIKNRNKKNLLYEIAYSLLFSVAMIFGAQIQKNGGVSYLDIKTWVSIFIVACITFFVVSILFLLRDRNNKITPEDMWEEEKERPLFKQKLFWGLIILFLICWFPVFLSAYPGYFLYDAQTELVMVQTADYTTHHPLAHVLLLGWIIKIVHKITDSYNLGIAVYLWCQAIFVAMSFSYILSRLRVWNVASWIRGVSIFYLCAFPVIPMYVFCSTKDVLFSAFLLLFFVNLIDFYRKDRKEQEIAEKTWIMMLINGIAMLLFRNNGIYALLIALPFIVGVTKKRRKKLFGVVGVIIAIYILCSWGLQLVTHAEKAGSQEILTIPIQQVARVYNYNRAILSQDEIQTLYQYLPEEALLRYKPDLSDQVKIAFNNEEFSRDSGRFLKLWINIGLEQPFTYLNAFFANNYGFWYPYAELNCYEGNQVFTYTYEDSSYFGYETELPGERKSLIPALDNLIRSLSLEISWQKIPGLRVLFHPAYYFWFFLFGFFYQLSKKNVHVCAVAFLALLMYLTVLLGPAVLVRYVLYFYFGFPLLLAFVFANKCENVCLDEVV